MKCRWGFLLGLLVLIPTFVVLQDGNCAKYGNGFFTQYKKIYHGVYITYINGTMLTHGKDRDFAAIIWPDMVLVTSDGDSLPVERMTKYSVNQGRLLVQVKSTSPTTVAFSSQEEVMGPRPMALRSTPDVPWVDLEKKPLLVYFWNPIVLLLIICETGLLILAVLLLFRSRLPPLPRL